MNIRPANLLFVVAPILSVSLTTGCSACNTSPGGCTSDPYEPDDTFPQAATGMFDTTMRACINPASDLDNFVFQVPTGSTVGGVLSAQLAEASLDMTPGLALFGPTTAAIAQFPGTSAGENVAAFLAVAPGQSIYVQVYSVSGAGSYGLRVHYAPVNDPNEPDDTPALAKPLGDGGVASGLYQFHPFSSSTPLPDYLTLQAHDGGVATVSVSGLPPTLNPEVHLYDSNQNELASLGPADAGADGGLVLSGPIVDGGVLLNLTAAVPAAGTYYIKVSASDRTTDWVGPGQPPAQFTQTYTVTATAP